MMMMLVRTVFSIVNILYKLATLDGMSQRIIVAYRFMLGASVMIPLALIFERKRPNLSWMVLVQAFFCGLFGGSLLHNMYIESLTLTSPTFVSATNNLVPAITFIMAITIGVEKLACETMAGKAKVLGTLIAIGGAMVLTFYKGVQINMKPTHVDLLRHGQNGSNSTHQSTTAHHLLGALLALCSSTSNAIWLNIQAKMSEKYPCAYSSTALTCTMAAIQSTVFALCMEKDMSRWKLGWNIRLLTVAVSGILASGLMFSVVFWVVSIRGPLYASVFNPLTLVLTAFGSFLFLQEKLYLGRSVVIICNRLKAHFGSGDS
ncbi:hypothetical protein PTKIN_Ptkin02bG0226900 [Pterospermum kingtungense]